MNNIYKNKKISVMQAYKSMFALLDQYLKTLKEKGAHFALSCFIGDILFDSDYDSSLDPACWSEFAYLCSNDEDKANENDQITIEKGYQVMIDFLKDYCEPWEDIYEGKQTILKLVNLIESDKSYRGKYLHFVQKAIDGKINIHANSIKEKEVKCIINGKISVCKITKK